MNKPKYFAEALALAQSNINKTISKDAKNNGNGGYKYISGSTTLMVVKEALKDTGLSYSISISTDEPIQWEEKITKNGSKMYSMTTIGLFTWYFSNDDHQDTVRLFFPMSGENTDKAKAIGSALTYSERYILSKQLGIPSDDLDPDNNNHPSNKVNYNKIESITKPVIKPTSEKGKEIYKYIQGLVDENKERWSQPIQFVMKEKGIKKLSDILIDDIKAEELSVEIENLQKLFNGEYAKGDFNE